MAFTIENLERVMAEFSRLEGPDREKAVQNGLRSVAATTQSIAKEMVDTDSGELKTSIRYKLEKEEGGINAYVYTNSDHAAFVEFGTGPVGAASGGSGAAVMVSYSLGPWKHVSKNGKVFYTDYWVYRDADGNFWATRGQPAKPFMYPAAQAGKKIVVPKMAKAFERFVKRLAGGD